MKPRVLFLVGPTACGKSQIAIQLAKQINAEIISADSMLVYRGMNIGTAKPTLRERGRVVHHLVDILPSNRSFSIYEYRKRALRCIRGIVRRGKLPLIVGGSGLYIRALWAGWSAGPQPDRALRRKLEREAKTAGLSTLYDRLRAAAPARALLIKPTDQKRIIRALEIVRSGQCNGPASQPQRQAGLSDLGYDPVMIGIDKNRILLYRDIERRVDKMFRQGLVREARVLSTQRVSKTARQALGYKELFEFFGGLLTLEAAKDLIKKRTRHFAKRQMTWFRREPVERWFVVNDGDSPRVTSAAILHWLKMQSLV